MTPSPPRTRRRSGRAALLAALLAAAVALPAAAYTIYLKDGSKLIAQEKYRVEGGTAYMTLLNGTQASLRAAEIDVSRTEEANRENLGAAVLIEGGEAVEAKPAPAPRRRTLEDLIHEGAVQGPAPARPAPMARGAGPGATAAPPAAGPAPDRTAGGYPDLATLPREPFPGAEVKAAINTYFHDHGIDQVEVVRGTAADRPLVEVTTGSEAAVFRAVALAASALAQLRRQGDDLPALELLLTTPAQQRAGQFVLTPELADELLSEKVDVATFFLAHVQF